MEGEKGTAPAAAGGGSDGEPAKQTGGEGSSSSSSGGGGGGGGRFECNICLETAKDAVVSLCGHLFCWPCIHQWLETRPNRQLCPVCKSAITAAKLIPLYGRGAEQTDPRSKPIPPRPQGQRHEPAAGSSFGNLFGGGDPFGAGGGGAAGLGGAFGGGGIQFSFGIGAFPFTLFGQANGLFDGGRPPAAQPGSRQYEEERRVSNLFIWVAVIFIVWLLFA